ncbi:hypothetical protein CP985_11835 [Malaciobacter mytili LMG 24559]|uniref:Uncharacterized protein n=1 Tax=Malaciobacter mytili LMG 24559 TaxID=1032238 RepID=A0AAX2AFY6_9BACT|nr:hypothetical protein [Malaciobacter mytili]AXH16346.1 hypothetical protein AMYT_a0046 [Malaciobacter mytili LMG 24559]RXK14803.1 hypothetical protein CP985_11835 [Malaciobacter mytili LMG 24559]
MATVQDIKKLKEEYQNRRVYFEGNEDIEGFYGEVDNFRLDTDNSIIVILRDMEDQCFDIDWKEIEDLEFES